MSEDKTLCLKYDMNTKTAYLYGKEMIYSGDIFNINYIDYKYGDPIDNLYIMEGVTFFQPIVLSDTKFEKLKRLYFADSIKAFDTDEDSDYITLSMFLMNLRELEYLKLPGGIERIKNGIISESRNLKEIFIPAGINDIPANTFASCGFLTDITVDKKNETYMSIDGVLFSNGGNTLRAFPRGRTGSYIVPEQTLEIDCYAFAYSGLDEIILHDNIRRINEGAFKGCSNLKYIRLPKAIKYISGSAFDGCTEMSNIIVDESCSNYRVIDGMLYTDDNTEIVAVPKTLSGEYNIPEGVITLGEYAFCNCRFTKVTIPESVRVIKRCCFAGCSCLTEAVITGKRTLSQIDSSIFADCANIKNIRYNSEDAKLPQKLKFGRRPNPFKKFYDEIIIAPNVLLSQVDKEYMPTVAAGFAEMALNNEEIPVFVFENAVQYIKDHIELFYEKSFYYIPLLKYLLIKELVPIDDAVDLLIYSEQFEDKRISELLQDYVDKRSCEQQGGD